MKYCPLAFLLLTMISLCGEVLAAAQDTAPRFFWPQIRHADPEVKLPESLPQRPLKLLVDSDFAPFTFKTPDSQITGVSVDLAMLACQRLNFSCTVIEKPFADLLPALLRKEGDVVLSGHRLSRALLLQVAVTRPYYLSSGRFFVRSGSQIESADRRNLADKKLGFIEGTTHAAFLEKYYGRSELRPMKTETQLYEAVRTGAVDVAFADSLRVGFWLRGASSRNCCQVLGGAYIDPQSFTSGLGFLMLKDRTDLTTVFDIALDQLEAEGKTAEIFNRYLPAPLW